MGITRLQATLTLKSVHRDDRLNRSDTMQYITQVPASHDQTAIASRQDLPSIQIVKDQLQPMLLEEAPMSGARSSLIPRRGPIPRAPAAPPAPRARALVEPIGIEPMTSCLQSRRSPS